MNIQERTPDYKHVCCLSKMTAIPTFFKISDTLATSNQAYVYSKVITVEQISAILCGCFFSRYHKHECQSFCLV